MKPLHWSQNELKPLNQNHRPQMLSAADSKTHYQSKFPSPDQTSPVSSDNIDASEAWPICGAHVRCGCNLETVPASSQNNLHQRGMFFSAWFTTHKFCAWKRQQHLYRVYSTEPSLNLPQDLKADICQRGNFLWSQVSLGLNQRVLINWIGIFTEM